ncbi:MAG: ABC transporter substrate-binding protein [Rhodopila sp.]|nr:ABC transporter substrate-binding protein [Rhodopila sp.]
MVINNECAGQANKMVNSKATPALTLGRRTFVGAAAATAGLVRSRRAAAAQTIRIGVLTDMSGPFADNSGPGSVVSAELAAADFMAAHPELKVEVISADMLNKPDVGANIARKWYDEENVDLILDVPSSAVALAVGELSHQRDKLIITVTAGDPRLTGAYCKPTLIQWTYDLWALANATSRSLVAAGGNKWFTIAGDYVTGHDLAEDVAQVVESLGAKSVGKAFYPFPQTTDFSSFLLQAVSSGASIVACSNAGADAINILKQAHEFQLAKQGVKLAALVMTEPVIKAIGLEAAQGTYCTAAFYWDMNDGTRAFAERFEARRKVKPTMFQAGAYSAATHFLKAVAAAGPEKAKASGKAIADQMKAMRTNDPLFGTGQVRQDGKFIHPMYVFRVKSPDESKYPWDFYTLVDTIPADKAFQSIEAAGCKPA